MKNVRLVNLSIDKCAMIVPRAMEVQAKETVNLVRILAQNARMTKPFVLNVSPPTFPFKASALSVWIETATLVGQF